VKPILQSHEHQVDRQAPAPLSVCDPASEIKVALLTGGGDRPYAFGLATELISKGATLEVIGGDDLDCPELRGKPRVHFLNLRGDQRPDASFTKKAIRVLRFYVRLLRYAAHAEPKIFHILWNNKFQLFDRTFLMMFYRMLGKQNILTVHNVNAGTRDSEDTFLNRLTLRIQYRLAAHLFVHTEKMKSALIEEFDVQEARITVIPFGINNAVPHTRLTSAEAKRRLGLGSGEKAILFFGNIAPYKGLEFLVTAFQDLVAKHPDYRLIIAGRPKNCEKYWNGIRERIRKDVDDGRILLRADYIPDDETEVYFKAADVLALPYRYIYQSGVLFLGYSFGLPVLVADVGSLKDEVVEGQTGYVFRPEDAVDLMKAIHSYFSSALYQDLSLRRDEIREYAMQRHSWDVVGQMTMSLYASLLRPPWPSGMPKREASKTSLNTKIPY
jgi:glycosyltransferase involved in cell wall biosynthesis